MVEGAPAVAKFFVANEGSSPAPLPPSCCARWVPPPPLPRGGKDKFSRSRDAGAPELRQAYERHGTKALPRGKIGEGGEAVDVRLTRARDVMESRMAPLGESAMQAKPILAWATAVLLAALAVGLLHALLGLANP